MHNISRSDLIWQVRSRHARLRQLVIDHPAVFRAIVRLPPSGQRLGELLQPWQERDFAALDPTWLQLAGRTGVVNCWRAYLERPRGHSKTTDTAVQLAWILLAARQRLRGLAAAADREQATLLHTALADLIRANLPLLAELQIKQQEIVHRTTGSSLRVLSSDVSSSWGLLPDFVVCDELCHWPHEELWQSLLSSAAKKPNCLLMILTNAGFGTGWTWQVREAARTSPGWYFSSLPGPHAHWITAEALTEQQRLLPPAVYARLWLNQWQHSDGEYVSLAEVEGCRSIQRCEQERGVPGCEYIAAIDYAEKHDRTVGVVVHREGDRIVVDRMDVVMPQPGVPTPVQWVEDWITQMTRRFRCRRIVVDEFQLLDLVQRLSSLHPLERFPFGSGLGNHRLAVILRRLILERRVEWYPGCGTVSVSGSAQADTLETELASLIVRESSQGRLRFDHRHGGHDDRSFALAVACWASLESQPTSNELILTPPTFSGDFAWGDG